MHLRYLASIGYPVWLWNPSRDCPDKQGSVTPFVTALLWRTSLSSTLPICDESRIRQSEFSRIPRKCKMQLIGGPKPRNTSWTPLRPRRRSWADFSNAYGYDYPPGYWLCQFCFLFNETKFTIQWPFPIVEGFFGWIPCHCKSDKSALKWPIFDCSTGYYIPTW